MAPGEPEVIKEASSEHVMTSGTQSSENTMKLMHLLSKFATLPEGRVHGGRLMEMLSGYSFAVEPSSGGEVMVTVEHSLAYAMVHEWI